MIRPFLAYYGLIFCCVVLFFNGWYVHLSTDPFFVALADVVTLRREVFVHIVPGAFDHATFWTSYIPIIIFPLIYVANKLYTRSSWVS